jgi:hypothetical protein
VIASGDEQFVERSPVVSPVEIKADALAQFDFINLAAPPFVENVLIAGKNGFDAENHGPAAGQRALLEQRRGMALGRGQSMVVADEDDIGAAQSALDLFGVEQGIVVAKRLVELAQIFAAAVRVESVDFAFHFGQRAQLRGAAAGAKIGGGGHDFSCEPRVASYESRACTS